MRSLIVEDDFTSRTILLSFLQKHGETHVAANGKEAVDAFRSALDENRPYDLICLDIMMPILDGKDVLRIMRDSEARRGIQPGEGVKILMTTGVSDPATIIGSFREQCDGYLVKPLDLGKLAEQIRAMNAGN
jgi:two-component system chemotaxis response regulator CheY